MIIVVDTNIVFSALLSHNSAILQTLLRKEYEFVSPSFIFVELFKYKEKILRHSKLTETELLELMTEVVSRVKFISHDFISAENLSKAIGLCKDIDIKDTVFVALAIELNAALWTGDKGLKAALNIKGFDQFFSNKIE